nr:Os01g0890250 [Ipomoea trifida]
MSSLPPRRGAVDTVALLETQPGNEHNLVRIYTKTIRRKNEETEATIIATRRLSSFQIKNWGDPLGSIPHENFPGRGSSLPIQDLIKFRFPVFLFTFSLIPGINVSLSPLKLSQTMLSPCFTTRSPVSCSWAAVDPPPPPEIFITVLLMVLYHIPRKEEEEFPGRKNPNAKFPPAETKVRFRVTDSPGLRLSVLPPRLQEKHRKAKKT